MKQIRHLFWDFDGTLFDSYPEILGSFMKGLEDLGLQELADAGNLMPLIKKYLATAAEWCAAQSGLTKETIMNAYRFHHAKPHSDPPYEGLEDCLRRLHESGYHHYLYTHSHQSAIDQLVRENLWQYFDDAVIGSDGFPLKPAPDALLALMERNHLSPETCAMIGDRDIDAIAGHNAGMKGILFDPDGYFPDFHPELTVRSMKELADTLLES